MKFFDSNENTYLLVSQMITRPSALHVAIVLYDRQT
jgi:hypothetical protein